MTVARADVERLLGELFIDAPGAGLRKEDLKKSHELAALLTELSRVGRAGPLVDVAAGKAYVGLLAVELLGFERLTVIERNAARLADVRHAQAKLSRPAQVELKEGDVGDRALWPRKPGAVVALHACGPASDATIDAAIEAEAKWLLLVPCCYSAEVPAWSTAEQKADALGLPSHAEVRRRFVQAFIDAERTLRLEAAGWETTVVPFVAPTVTPHNLLFRARRLLEPRRMADASARRARLLG
ncbi:MAG: methyltransferase [Myxococcota bacterium]